MRHRNTGVLAFPGGETKVRHIWDTVFVCFFLFLGLVSLIGGALQAGLTLQNAIDACWPTRP